MTYYQAETEYLYPSERKYTQDEVDEIVDTLERIIDDQRSEIDGLRYLLAELGVNVDD